VIVALIFNVHEPEIKTRVFATVISVKLLPSFEASCNRHFNQSCNRHFSQYAPCCGRPYSVFLLQSCYGMQ